MSQEQHPPDKQLLHEFLWYVMKHTDQAATELTRYIGEGSYNQTQMKGMLMNLQSGTIYRLLSLIDGAGPNHWPELQLVNGETGEKLSGSLQTDWSQAESDYLDSVDSDTEVSADDV